MNFSNHYGSRLVRKITIVAFILSLITGIVFFESDDMIAIFVFIISFIAYSSGKEIIMLFAGEDLVLEMQIGEIGISYLKLAVTVLKLNSEITDNSIERIEKYIKSEFNEEIALLARKYIQKNKLKNYSIKNTCNKLYGLKHVHKLQFLYQLFSLVFINEEFTKKQEQTIYSISKELNINKLHYNNIKSMFNKSAKSNKKQEPFYSSHKGNKQINNYFSGINYAYIELGVNKNITDSELKKAYRNLAKKYHPDKFSTFSKQEQKKAKERFQGINNAYSLIMKLRKL